MKKTTLLVFFAMSLIPALALPPAIVSFTPASASAGMTVTINGTDFTGTTAVAFGGTPATSFTIISSTQITALVPLGTSGQVSVTNADGTGSKTGFNYVPTSGIITDFNGWWSTTGASPSATQPDNSHNLLAYTYNGVTYSTGVNNASLTSHGISFTPGSYKALPVAGIAGTSGLVGSNSTYLALARKIDGSATVANAPAVSNFSVKQALVDGPGGLNLGSGVTNLPASALLTFQIYNINASSINDAEPDILLTQIAQPVTGNDQYSFVDATGAVVGSTLTVDMTLLPSFGSYILDLFHLTPSTPYNNAAAYSVFATNTTREIRLTGLRLSDFGITAGNVGQVRALRITPSGNSDYAFIAYNTQSINLPPNISQDPSSTNATVCAGGTANFSVVSASAMGGALSYTWEESTNGGSSWNVISDGGNILGATTSRLSVTNPTHGYRYRANVSEENNPGTATSSSFTATVSTPTPPSSVSISGSASVCLNDPTQLAATVTGGSNLYYQWQTNASGPYTNIPGANLQYYQPPVNSTGTRSYQVVVTSGNGCGSPVTSAPLSMSVTGVSTTLPSERCGTGTLQLSGSATSGAIDWYSADAGGSSLFTGTTFTTPSLSASKTYYISASGCATALRVPVKATVHPLSVGGMVNGGGMVNPGNNSSVLTLTGHTGSIANWQSSTDGFVSDINNIPHTSAELVITNLVPTTSYRAVVKSGNCADAYSGMATIFTNGTLPVHFGSLAGKIIQDRIHVQWTGFAEMNTISYELQKSTDGVRFETIYAVKPHSAYGSSAYSFDDLSPQNGHNYYRVREITTSGHSLYTNIIDVVYNSNETVLRVFPIPTTGKKLSVQLSNADAGIYQVQLVNQAGQAVHQERLTHSGGQLSKEIQFTGRLSTGIYRVVVTGNNFRKATTIVVAAE